MRALLTMAFVLILAVIASPLGIAAIQNSKAPPATLSQADLEELLGPIALYPDSLLANVLAASVYPDEVVAATQYSKDGGTPDGIDQQTWEPPVKSIAKVPEVLDFLADNIEWTTAVGEVYITQSQDVMTAIQSLRAKAKSSGALQSSEQMTVVESGETIVIEPAQPQVVYVPQYDPQVVYVDDDDSGEAFVAGMIGFGAGLLIGEAFDDDWDCDWDNDCVGWGGDNDVDIDRNFEAKRETNIETGDININVGSGNTVEGGDRTNVRGGDTTNVGREGQKWEPNTQKVEQRRQSSGGTRASDQFRGVSDKSATSRSKVPTKTSASDVRKPATPLRSSTTKPNVTPARDHNRGAASGPSTRQAPKPATKAPSSRSIPKPATAAPKPPGGSKPAARSSGSSGRGSSGFSPSGGSSRASSRGASSRGGGAARGGGRGGGGRR